MGFLFNFSLKSHLLFFFSDKKQQNQPLHGFKQGYRRNPKARAQVWVAHPKKALNAMPVENTGSTCSHFSSQYILLYFLSFLFLCFSFLFIFFSFLFVCFLLFSFFFSCSLRKYSPHTTQFPQVVSRYEQKFRQVHILAQTADSDFRFCKKVTISLHTLQLVDLRFTVIFTYIEAQQHSKISFLSFS